MLVAGDDDFTNFLQLVNDFPSFDEAQAAHHGFETPMGDLGMHQLAMGSSMEDIRGPSMQADVSFPEGARGDMIHGYAKIPPGANPVAHAQAIQQRHHHAQRQHPREAHRSPYDTRIMVPPTPQSSEMQGAAVRYYHYMHGDSHSDLEAYQRQRDDQVSGKA